jgi:FkbM family methyltransferase
MLVIYPFSLPDEQQALKNANWIGDLGGCQNHDALILADRRCDNDVTKRIETEFKSTFQNVHLRMTQGDIDGWPMGANHMFGFATCIIANNAHVWPHFLWLEPDAIPIKEGWLDTLEAEYRKAGKKFMGEKVDLGEKRPDVPVHMSGVAIYPNPIVKWAGECCRAHDVAWDIAAKDQIMPLAYFTKQIQHYWKHGTFTSLNGIRPEVVLFHSSKDGSLIDLLREKAAPGLNQNSVPTEPTSDKSSREEIGTRAVQPSIKILPLNGAWVLEGDTIISDEVERSGRLDFDTLIPYVLKYVRPGDTVVDVGAFIGDHTVAYADAVGPDGEVYAYEPNPTAFKCLVHNTEGMSNVFGFCHALGSTNGLEQMDFSIPNAASNYINHEGKGESIQVRPLDVDAALFHRVDLIKIDVEGYELNVLKGMEHTIDKFHPKLVVEINEIALGRQDTDAQTVVSWIVRHGYSVSILHRHKDAIFYDILALPAAKPPESVSSAAAHTPNQPVSATPVAAPTVKEEIEWHVGVLKQFCENSPQTKALVMQKLVYAGLRLPNKKTKHAKPKTHKHTNGQRGAVTEECKT